MNLRRAREVRQDETTDIIREIERKLVSGTLGRSPEEMLANTVREFDKFSSNIEAALMKFVTEDPAMLRVKAIIRLLYKRAEPVLITGPTGTGKELLAKALKEPGQPFVAENCAALPENLAESIFFGHKKGAFTGAVEDHIGLLEQAGEGIIFLDEIGDMSLTLQAKLLRAIQENEIRKVGDVHTIDISCRFVAATKYDLEERVAQRLFREDLYARLFAYSVHVTGLKDRQADIPVITRAKLGNPDSYDQLPPFGERELDIIYKYNVRGIEALLARHRAGLAYI